MVKVQQAVNSSTKHYHKTQAQNASTNGGDASRVGHKSKGSYTTKQRLTNSTNYMSACEPFP